MAGQRLKKSNHWFEISKDLFKKSNHWYEVKSKFYKHAGHWYDASTSSKGFVACFTLGSTTEKISAETQEEFDILFIEALEKYVRQPKITLTYEE